MMSMGSPSSGSTARAAVGTTDANRKNVIIHAKNFRCVRMFIVSF